MDGDDAAFIACFAENACVYPEPELSSQPLAANRLELARWIADVRAKSSRVAIDLVAIAEYDAGVVADAVIVGDNALPEAWRLALAIRWQGELITEIRSFRDHNDAVAYSKLGNRELPVLKNTCSA
jgi:hypothetical protein